MKRNDFDNGETIMWPTGHDVDDEAREMRQ